MSELCPTCGQEMPDEPVRMTEEVGPGTPGESPAVREEASRVDS